MMKTERKKGLREPQLFLFWPPTLPSSHPFKLLTIKLAFIIIIIMIMVVPGLILFKQAPPPPRDFLLFCLHTKNKLALLSKLTKYKLILYAGCRWSCYYRRWEWLIANQHVSPIWQTEYIVTVVVASVLLEWEQLLPIPRTALTTWTFDIQSHVKEGKTS